MKNAIIMIAFVAFATTSLKAQTTTTTDNRAKLTLGVKAGTNYSNVYDSEGEDFVADGKFGLAAGAFVVVPLGKIFGIQPEVLYSQKGFKSTGTFLGTNYEMTRTTDFIDVPILISIKPVEYVSLLFGPQFSFLMKQTDDFTGGSLSTSQQDEFDNSNLRKNIFGLTGGVDFNIDHLVIGLRGGWDVKNNDGDGNSTTPRYKNMWYQATIGYKF
ncbi:porin family protein [Flavobacterium chungnamense]|uniref:Outer membrane protein beta-barrel domain-containing protein n=1 Tax=Flavobacterium chungnamense TaxID=706182 RepID=A0ABP7V4R8_9FLAO